MATKTGHLMLADISGYTAFVAETELEHSREILNELLETLVRGLAEHLRIGQIEGDAIFALGESIPADPNAWLQDIFIRFHRHLNAIKRVSTCPCRACVSAGTLTLKFICHYGEYLPQSFLGKETFVGNAVNQVHRLLKNKVPSREYLLVTKEASERFPAETRSMFTPHLEEYDAGAVECGWMDLAPLRNDPRTDEVVKVVDADRAQLTFQREYDAPGDRLWALFTDPAVRERWMGADVSRVDYQPGARHTMVGGEYHCHHGQGELAIFRIMEARRPATMTALIDLGGMFVWNTVTIDELPEGRSRLTSRYRFDGDLPEEMLAMGRHGIEEYEHEALPGIAEELARDAQAVAPA